MLGWVGRRWTGLAVYPILSHIFNNLMDVVERPWTEVLRMGCPPKTHVFQGFYDLFRLLPPNLPPNYHAIDRIVGSLWTKYQPCPDTVMVRFLPKRPEVRGKRPLDSVPRTGCEGYCIPDHGPWPVVLHFNYNVGGAAKAVVDAIANLK